MPGRPGFQALLTLCWLLCCVAEPDAAEVMVIRDSEDEDTLDSSWSSDSEDSSLSTGSSFSSAVSGDVDSSSSCPSLSACSSESFDESED